MGTSERGSDEDERSHQEDSQISSEHCSDEDERSDHEDLQISSLQELCMRSILLNFDRLCAGFKMPNSNVPKKNQEFLARRFSERLFQDLKEAEKLKSEHLDFLINPHMRKLDIIGIDREILPDLIKKLREHGNNILTFEAYSEDVRGDIWTSLMSTLPKVEEIDCEDFSDYRGPKKRRKKLFRFGKRLKPKPFSNIPHICRAIGQSCPSLKSLKFGYGDGSSAKKYNDGIAFILENCPHLEKLQYRDSIGALYALHKSNLPSLRTHKKGSLKTSVTHILKNLSSDDHYYPLHDALLICVATCPCVSRLNMDVIATDKELEMISRFIHLEEITLKRTVDISPSCLREFLLLRGDQLTSLEMPYETGLPIETLIECCPKLQSLKLNHLQFSGLNVISEQSCKLSLPNLKTAEFSYTDFAIPQVSHALKLVLSSAKHISTLSLISCSGLTKELLTGLEFSSIRILDITYSDITVDSLTELLLRRHLEKLNLNYCEKISFQDYFALTGSVSDNNKNIDINYSPVRSTSWGGYRCCCMAYLP